MGNVVISSPCFQPNISTTSCCNTKPSQQVKLIFWEGTSRSINNDNKNKKKKHMVAGEIMFEFPDKVVCHADSFFIGHPIPILSFDDQLLPGQTYFVLPIDLFSSQTLSASTLAALNSSSSSSPSPSSSCPKINNNRSPIKFGACPFEYIKGDNGRALIKVMPEFITSLIINNQQQKEEEEENHNSNNGSFLCSTPELQKHYEQLVMRSKEQVWSPKLETISEYKIRFSPCRFIGLEWKEKEDKHQEIFSR